MKKLIALLLALAMVFALAACGGNDSDTAATDAADTTDTSDTATTDTAEDTADSAAADDAADTSDDASDADADLKTANPGKLTMATNAAFPPYEYIEGGEITGIDAEIAGAIAEKLGLELQIDDMEFDSIIEAVKGGKADIGLAGMTVTPDRQQQVDFTATYATGVQVIIVNEDNDTIAGTNDDLALIGADGSILEGTVIGVQRNTTGDLFSTWYMEDLELATVERYSRGADAVQALKTGKVDCVIIDNEPAKAFVSQVEGLKILEAEYVIEDYAGAMSKDNPDLYAAVNAVMEDLIADGTIQAIIDKYITAE